ncbi:MAG: hypothetical protein AB7T38_13150 [Nitrospirales bacterium]
MQIPPQIFFDTNVLLGLNPEGIAALKKLQVDRGFRYRYSMLNFVELVSHLGDTSCSKTHNPFRKNQAVLEKIYHLFDPRPLPSPESVFMKAVGLYHYLGPSWKVNEEGWVDTLGIMVKAKNLAELQTSGFNPEHYKVLRGQDEKWFLKFIEKARGLGNFPTKSQHENFEPIDPQWGTFLGQFYECFIYRASSERITFSALGRGEKKRVLKFFSIDSPGGGIFLMHFVHLLRQTLIDQKKEDANDFYDMLQLLLLKDGNLLFVTDDRPFHQYYAGAQEHRVVSWKFFKASAF